VHDRSQNHRDEVREFGLIVVVVAVVVAAVVVFRISPLIESFLQTLTQVEKVFKNEKYALEVY